MTYETLRVPVDWDDDDVRREHLLGLAKQRWEPFAADEWSVFLRREYRRPISGKERFFRSALFPLLLVVIGTFVLSLILRAVES